MYKRDSEELRPDPTLDVWQFGDALGVLASHCVAVRIHRAALHDLPIESVTSSSNRPGNLVEIEGTDKVGHVILCSTCIEPQSVVYEDGKIVSPLPSKKALGRCLKTMLEHEEFVEASAPRNPREKFSR